MSGIDRQNQIVCIGFRAKATPSILNVFPCFTGGEFCRGEYGFNFPEAGSPSTWARRVASKT